MSLVLALNKRGFISIYSYDFPILRYKEDWQMIAVRPSFYSGSIAQRVEIR